MSCCRKRKNQCFHLQQCVFGSTDAEAGRLEMAGRHRQRSSDEKCTNVPSAAWVLWRWFDSNHIWWHMSVSYRHLYYVMGIRNDPSCNNCAEGPDTVTDFCTAAWDLGKIFSLKSESLPPTSTEAAQHSFRTFLTVQQRKGNRTSWIQQNRDDAFGTTFWSLLELIKMAAGSILNLVSCVLWLQSWL